MAAINGPLASQLVLEPLNSADSEIAYRARLAYRTVRKKEAAHPTYNWLGLAGQLDCTVS